MSPAAIDELAREQGRQIADDLAKSDIRISADKEMVALIAYLQQLGKFRQPAATDAPKQAASH